MALIERSVVVGVFQDYKMAEQAIVALLAAGFSNEQIRYAGSAPVLAGSVLERIENISGKQDPSDENITQAFTDMGIAEPEALYYGRELTSGRLIVIVSPRGRKQDTINALQSNGAYGYSGAATETTGYVDTNQGER